MKQTICVLVAGLLLGSLASCDPKFFSFSREAGGDSFKGPSYGGYDTPTLFAANISIFFLMGNARVPGGVGSTYPVNPAFLLASTDARPGPVSPPNTDAFLSHVSFLYGAQLIGKGGKFSDRFGVSTSRRTYLEALGYAVYNYDLPNNKGSLFGGLGPYLGVGLWGTNSYEQSGRTTQSVGAFDQNQGGYSRLDAGLAFTAGYQLPQGLRLSIAHELGLANIDPAGGQDKTYTRVWSLNVGYPLKKLVALVKKK